MAIQKLHIEEFLTLANSHPVLDVRSPGEYKQAHIPGAYSLPLFTDEERKVVGTTYKQNSREAAIKVGLDYFGPKMRKMVEEVEELLRSTHAKAEGQNPVITNGAASSEARVVLVHCWRGGMRSAAIAWLLDLYGFKVYTLSGGYKKYRNWIVETFSQPYQFHILGGFTGSGKTYVLEEMQSLGARVINLEKIACHKGSAFGNIGMPDQPSQEMFENLLGTELRKWSNGSIDHKNSYSTSVSQPIWLEDESQRIGHVNIPQPLWNNMRKSPVYFLDIPFEERLKHVVKEYGILDRERMANAISRIQKRLGGLETKTALQHLQEGDIESCFRILLKYYDKWYTKGLNNRDNLSELLNKVPCNAVDKKSNAEKILMAEIIIK